MSESSAVSPLGDVKCAWTIRAWAKDDGQFRCRLGVGHVGNHVATGLFEYQTIEWMRGDRREFTGSFVECFTTADCMLPGGHPGRCAKP